MNTPTRRPPSTPFALLGLLSLGRGSGYDLKLRAESSIGHFWTESYGQIYPSLKQLEAKGWARSAPRNGQRGAARFEYSITPAGTTALKQWLAVSPKKEPFRSELLLKLFFGRAVPADVSAGHIRDIVRDEQRRLAGYSAVQKEIETRFRGAPELPYWLATLSYGRHRSQAILDWANETTAGLLTSASARAKQVRRRS